MAPSLDDIAYHLSSSKTKPNKIMRENILPFLQEQDVKRVLDYGCGKYLRDSSFLAKHNFIVDAVDIEEQVQRIDQEKAQLIHNVSTEITNNNYDAALLNFVIQVLPTEKQREEILEKVYEAIKKDGYLVLSLRNPRDIKHCVKANGTPFNDGFLMKKGSYYTFVRGYEREEIENMLDSFNLRVVQIYRTCDSFITLSQK